MNKKPKKGGPRKGLGKKMPMVPGAHGEHHGYTPGITKTPHTLMQMPLPTPMIGPAASYGG